MTQVKCPKCGWEGDTNQSIPFIDKDGKINGHLCTACKEKHVVTFVEVVDETD